MLTKLRSLRHDLYFKKKIQMIPEYVGSEPLVSGTRNKPNQQAELHVTLLHIFGAVPRRTIVAASHVTKTATIDHRH